MRIAIALPSKLSFAAATLVLSSSLAFVAACPAEEAPPAAPAAPTAVKPVGDAPPAPTAATAPPAPAAPPPAPAVELPEPEGIAADAHKAPAAPKGKGTWQVDPAATTVAFTIVSNSAGPITGKFPGGAAGAFDPKTKKGVFTIDLTKLSSTNKDGAPNPVRDTNVVEAFFGARPFVAEAQKAAVTEAWKKLAGKVTAGVSQAALVIDSVEGDLATVKDGASADGVVNGQLLLWNSVQVPVSFPVTATRAKDSLVVKGTAPAVFNIEKVTGSAIRKALFDTMLAAGCAHQPGIQNDVSVALEQVTLTQQKK